MIAKLAEETAEIEAELTRELQDRAALEAELGDLLFTAVNLTRHLHLEPEFALRNANAKFRTRFNAMETAAGSAAALRSLTPTELDELWRKAKLSTAPSELTANG
jgi:XTP/dITP diphosphohydrolase/ATP diphosphatase